MNGPTYPIVCRHPANDIGRDFVVGDLHGCVDALRYLEAATFVTGQTLYIDGGAHAGKW